MNYLLDTNVISETRRKRPDQGVLAFIKQSAASSLFVSVLSLGELIKGAALISKRDPEQGQALHDWIIGIRAEFQDQMIGIDGAIAEIWGRMSSERPLPVIDGLIAATAQARGLVLVTRNIRDFEDLGITLINPWTGAS